MNNIIDFSEVEKSVRELKKLLDKGELDEEAFEERLLEMVAVAEDGYYWMFGHESESWFRHDGEKWVPDDPGEIIVFSGEGNGMISNANPSSSHPATEHSPPLEWRSISWGWFIASLIILAIIGVIVYYSTLI